MVITIVNLECCTFVWDSFTRFLIKFNYLEIRFKILVVDKEFVCLTIGIDKHIKIGYFFSAIPSLCLMDCVNTIRQKFCTCKTVFVTNNGISFVFICIYKRTCRFKINLKLCTFFGCFDLSFTIISMFNNTDFTLDNLFHNCHIGSVIVFDCIIFRVCTYFIHRIVKQISLTRSNFLYRPIFSANIIVGSE